MIEEWKDIEGYPDYQVSNLGRVRSLNRYIDFNEGKSKRFYKGKILKPIYLKTNEQYLVNLVKDKKADKVLISTLVAKHFVCNDLKKTQYVLFKDNNKTNCRADNLYVITRKEFYKQPNIIRKMTRKYYKYNDKEYSVRQLQRMSGIKGITIHHRMCYLKWNIYEAVEVPTSICGRNKGGNNK